MGTKTYQQIFALIDPVHRSIQKRWFYRLGQKKYNKSIGFIDSVHESIKKHICFIDRATDIVKHALGGFIDRATEIV
jgi:hypothetical protein